MNTGNVPSSLPVPGADGGSRVIPCAFPGCGGTVWWDAEEGQRVCNLCNHTPAAAQAALKDTPATTPEQRPAPQVPPRAKDNVGRALRGQFFETHRKEIEHDAATMSTPLLRKRWDLPSSTWTQYKRRWGLQGASQTAQETAPVDEPGVSQVDGGEARASARPRRPGVPEVGRNRVERLARGAFFNEHRAEMERDVGLMYFPAFCAWWDIPHSTWLGLKARWVREDARAKKADKGPIDKPEPTALAKSGKAKPLPESDDLAVIEAEFRGYRQAILDIFGKVDTDGIMRGGGGGDGK